MPPDQYDKPYEGRLIINPVETKEDEQQLREDLQECGTRGVSD